LDLLDSSRTHEYLFAEVGAKSTDPIDHHHPDFGGNNQQGPIQSVRDTQWKLIRHGDDRRELYDWREDRSESRDRSAIENKTVAQLTSVIDESLGDLTGDPYSETVDDDRLKKKLEDLGYI
jgi:hypothetical protein